MKNGRAPTCLVNVGTEDVWLQPCATPRNFYDVNEVEFTKCSMHVRKKELIISTQSSLLIPQVQITPEKEAEIASNCWYDAGLGSTWPTQVIRRGNLDFRLSHQFARLSLLLILSLAFTAAPLPSVMY